MYLFIFTNNTFRSGIFNYFQDVYAFPSQKRSVYSQLAVYSHTFSCQYVSYGYKMRSSVCLQISSADYNKSFTVLLCCNTLIASSVDVCQSHDN